jgi:hypothetical protein
MVYHLYHCLPQAEQPVSEIVIPQLFHILRPCNIAAASPFQLYQPCFTQNLQVVDEAAMPCLGVALVGLQSDDLGRSELEGSLWSCFTLL